MSQLTSCFPVKSHFFPNRYGNSDTVEDENGDEHGFAVSWESTKKTYLTKGTQNLHQNGHPVWSELVRDVNGVDKPARNGLTLERPPQQTQHDSSWNRDDNHKPEHRSQHYAGTPQRSIATDKAQTGVLQRLHHINRSQNTGSRRRKDVDRSQYSDGTTDSSIIRINGFAKSADYESSSANMTGSSGVGSDIFRPISDNSSNVAVAFNEYSVDGADFKTTSNRNRLLVDRWNLSGNRDDHRPNDSNSSNQNQSVIDSNQLGVDCSNFAHLNVKSAGADGCSSNVPDAQHNSHIDAIGIIELLRMKIAYISGGRDSRGAFIISVPASDAHQQLPVEDLSLILSYLVCNIRSTSVCSGFTVIIDGRGLEARILVKILQALEEFYEAQSTLVYVVKPDIFTEQSKLLEIKTVRIISGIQVHHLTVTKLHRLFDLNQITEEFGGTLVYNHNQWIQNTMDFEKFKKESNVVLKDLNSSFSQLTEQMKRFSKSNVDETLQQLHDLYDFTMSLPNSTIHNGQQLLRKLETDQDSGFRSSPENGDSLVAQEKVKELLKSVFRECEKFEEVWLRSEHELTELLTFLNLEKGIKIVTDFILGPAESLLNSHHDIGSSYHEVDELKRKHECLELKCTETYGHYAELRHKCDDAALKYPNHPMMVDIKIQKEYMDAVCRSFATRLERRRNILISSSRFHRLTEEILQRSTNLKEVSQNDNVDVADAAKQNLQCLDEEMNTLISLRENAVQEGNRLQDNLALPVKNALGKDITPDYRRQLAHVQRLLDRIEEDMSRCVDTVDVRRIRLRRLVQMYTCEVDARQAIQWILDLCEVLVESHNQLGRTNFQVENLEEEHGRFEETAKETYDYGRQLLETALVLRKSCQVPLTPHNEIVQNLFVAWRKFLQGTQERKTRLNVCKMFYIDSDKLLDDLEKLRSELCDDLEASPKSRNVIRKHRATRDKLLSRIVETLRQGKTLLHKMKLPVIPSNDSHNDYGDESAAEQIQNQISIIESLAELIDNSLIEDEEPTASTSSDHACASYRSADDWHSATSFGPDDWKSCQSTIISTDEWKSAEDGVTSDGWYSAEDYPPKENDVETRPIKIDEEHEHTVEEVSGKSDDDRTFVAKSNAEIVKLFECSSEVQYREESRSDVFLGSEMPISSIQDTDTPVTLTTTADVDDLKQMQRSKEWLELKIQEMQPEITNVGSNLAEAQLLLEQHQRAQEKLQTKQSPVEELLNQTDHATTDRRPRPEVYSAMAGSLEYAWKELNAHLEYRKQLLEHAVQFQTRAKQFSDKMDEAEVEFMDHRLPEDPNECKDMIQRLNDTKKAILEASKYTLNDGQILLEWIKNILSRSSMIDARGEAQYRHSVDVACTTIERKIEGLNDRRRKLLDDLFLMRKRLLEDCLQSCSLLVDLQELEQWLNTTGKSYIRQNDLGESVANVEILRCEHRKMNFEIMKIHDRMLTLKDAANQLTMQRFSVGANLKSRCDDAFERCSELKSICDDRERIFSLSVNFFRSAEMVISKIDEIEVDISDSNASVTFTDVIQEANNCIDEGKSLLIMANECGTNGIKRTISDVENRKSNLEKLSAVCGEAAVDRTSTLDGINEQMYNLEAWLVQDVETYLRIYQDMGLDLTAATDFLNAHEKMLHEIQVKSFELDAISSLLSTIDSPRAKDYLRKMSTLSSRWYITQLNLEQRLSLAFVYVKVHRLYVQLSNEMNKLNEEIMPTETCRLPQQNFEEKQSLMLQLYQQISDVGISFADDAKKNKDKYVDIERAVVCVENLLDDLRNKKEIISRHWASYQSKSEDKLLLLTFTRQARQSETSVNQAVKDLYPLVPTELNTCNHIVSVLESRSKKFVSMLKCMQVEIDERIKSASSMVITSSHQDQRDHLLRTLNECDRRLHIMVADYQLLVSLLISFFNNLFELEKLIEKNERNYNVSIVVGNVSEAEILVREHNASNETIMELFRFAENEANQLIQKIEQLEPNDVALLDVNKVSSTLEMDKDQWQRLWQEHNRKLEREMKICQFNDDLKQIRQQVGELDDRLLTFRGNVCVSSVTSKAISSAFSDVENTVEMLKDKVQHFMSTSEKMCDQHYDSSHVRYEIDDLEIRWLELKECVMYERQRLDLSIEFYRLIEEAEDWCSEGGRILDTIARNSAEVQTTREADALTNEIEEFIKCGESKQAERFVALSSLATQIYDEEHVSRIQTIKTKNKETIDSLILVNEQLVVISENAKKSQKTEFGRDEDYGRFETTSSSTAYSAFSQTQPMYVQASNSVVRSEVYESRQAYSGIQSQPRKEYQPPEFLTLLGDARVTEGTKVRFECCISGYPMPQVTWYKDGITIENNPDYRTSVMENGLCTLTIEETFSEDSAKFTCEAVNVAGTAQTHGMLYVQEAEPQEELTAPDFVKRLDAVTVSVGESFQFECRVTGYPLPLVSWTKNDVCIDNYPDYTMTYNNGLCVLRFEEMNASDAAIYSCKASNQAGQASSSAQLIVQVKEKMEPPSFSTDLSNVMARAGQKIKLECVVNGAPVPDLTWLHNNKTIKETTKQTQFDGNRATLLITEAFPKDAGTYLIVAKNKAGETTSSCNVSVKGRLPMETSDSELTSDLEPTKPRVAVTLKPVSVIEGKKARLDCTIVGQPEPEVIWYHNGNPVKESNDFQLLFVGDQCSLVIKEAYLEDAGSYKCLAINSAGEASSQCQLTVQSLGEQTEMDKSVGSKAKKTNGMENTAPNFSKQLEDIEVKIGKEATLECSISGRPEPRVAWFKGGNKIEPSGDYQIARDKAGLLSLYITNVEVGDAGVYTVKATNDAGEAKSFATLTVTTTREADAQTATKPKTKAPHFIQLFADQTTKKGKRVAFECIVSGLPRPEIQWNFNDTPVRPWDYQISSAGERHWLKIPMVGPRHHGKYDITAENDEGKAVCTAQLIVTDDSGRVIPDSVSEEKKSVTTQKTTVTESKVTKVSSSSDVPSSLESHKVLRALNYTYKKVGDEPPEESTIGQRTEEHELSPVERREVKKLEGLAQSSLRRKPKAPMFKEPVEGVQMEAGNPLKLSAVVEGEPEPDIRWYRNDAELSGASTGVTVSYHDRKAELVVEKATSGDSGVYKCTAENPFGNASSSADVLVKASEEIAPAFKQPIEAVTISEGETAVFVAVITGKPTPAVTWYKNNTKLDEEQTNVNVSFSRGRAMLRLVKTNESDSGRYKCVATNSVGNVSCSRTLTVNPATALFVPPCFTNPLTNVSCGEGKTAVFRAKLEGKPEPSVRWFKDGAEIRPDSGKIKIDLKADEVKLTIPDTSVKDSGRYTCTVSNMAGTATSTANLNVQGSVMPPQFTKRLASMFVKSGDKVTMEVEVTAKPEPKVYWFKDDELLSNSPDFRISCRGNKHRLVIAEAFPDDSGKYAVVAKNDSGEAKSAADCIVEDESSQVGGGREVLKPEKEVGFARTPYVK